jgi:dUTP pyrophosphatase
MSGINYVPLAVHAVRVHPAARLPEYATDGSAGLDLRALEGAVIMPGQAATFDTGMAMQPPPGYATFVYARSGLSFKHGVRLANGVAVIDRDYTGSIKVRLHNDSDLPYEVTPGERIAQAIVQPLPRVQLLEVNALEDTARGAGGIGSTGR